MITLLVVYYALLAGEQQLPKTERFIMLFGRTGSVFHDGYCTEETRNYVTGMIGVFSFKRTC